MSAGETESKTSASITRRAALRQQIHESLVGTGATTSTGVVLMVGSVGIGKTTFAQQLAVDVESSGAQVGWGVAGEFSGTPPLWPWRQALDAISDDHPLTDNEPAESDGSPIGTEHAATYQAVAAWLHQQSLSSPLLIVLEDLHEADSSTVSLLRYLSRRPRRGQWMVVGTSRRLIDEQGQLRGPIHRLDGLDAAEISAVAAEIGSPLTSAEAHALRDRTDGNPLFVRRLLEHATDTTSTAPDLLAVVRSELNTMSDRVVPVASALSVLGPSSDVALIAEVAQLGRDDVLAAVDDDTLTRREQTVAFSHALLRDVVYDDLNQAERSSLHERAADALARRKENPIRVAYHLRAASDHDHPDAARFATRAGALALAAGAFAEAIEHCTAAVTIHERLAERGRGDEEELAQALVLQARALSYSGQVSDAEDTLTAAAHLTTELGPASKASILREFIRLRWREEPNPTGLSPERLVQLAELWFGRDAEPSEHALLCLARLGGAEIKGFVLGDLAFADAAIAAAEAARDPLLIAEAYLGRRRALIPHNSAYDERRTATRTARSSAALVDDAELTARIQRMAMTDAVAECDRAEALAVAASMDEVPTAGLREHEALWRCGLDALQGRRTEAAAILDEASLELSYLGLEAPALIFVRAIFALDEGNLSEALADFIPLMPALADPLLDSAAAIGAFSDGDKTRATGHLNRAIDTLTTNDSHMLWALAAALASEAAAALDHPAVADLLDLLTPYAGRAAVPTATSFPWVGAFDRYIGLLHLRLGNDQEAYDALSESLRLHHDMRAHPWTARSHAALAVAADRLGRSAEADGHRGHAARLGADCSMGDVLLLGDFGGTTHARVVADTEQATFVHDGSMWHLGFAAQTHAYRDLAGLSHLQRLVASPDSDWHALDLYGLGAAAPGTTVIEGSSGPMIDDEARRAYQARYFELSATLEEADRNGDLGTAERTAAEIDELESALLTSFGLGGRTRQLDDPAERARINVRRSITRAIEAIAGADPAMADHLRYRVTTGRFCRYAPDPMRPIEWHVTNSTQA